MPTEPDLPKFDALRDFLNAQTGVSEHIKRPITTWIDKLEEWSKDRLTEKEQLEDQLRDFEEDQEKIIADAETWRWLQDDLHDVRLGLSDWHEFWEHWAEPTPWIGERTEGGRSERYGEPWER